MFIFFLSFEYLQVNATIMMVFIYWQLFEKHQNKSNIFLLIFFFFKKHKLQIFHYVRADILPVTIVWLFFYYFLSLFAETRDQWNHKCSWNCDSQ